jgi:hypothetical protein
MVECYWRVVIENVLGIMLRIVLLVTIQHRPMAKPTVSQAALGPGMSSLQED